MCVCVCVCVCVCFEGIMSMSLKSPEASGENNIRINNNNMKGISRE